MKILHTDSNGYIIGYRNHKFESWFEFLMFYTRHNLNDNESCILKAKQDDTLRHYFPLIPTSAKENFYIVTITPNGDVKLSFEGDTIRIKGTEYNSINEFVKQYQWT